MARREAPRSQLGTRCPTGSSSTLVRWIPLLVTALAHLRPVSAAGRLLARVPDVGQRSEPHGRGAVPVPGAEVHRRDGARGRGAGPDRAAGLPLQPHRLRFIAGGRAGLLHRPRPRERAGPRAHARGRGHAGAPRSRGDPLPRRPRAPPRDARAGDPLPRRDALARRRRCGRDPRRGQPPDHPAAERRRARRRPRLDPHVRRPDGAGRGRGHRGGGSGRPADAPAHSSARSTIPTIVPDPTLTSARREQLRASVDPIRYGVRSGERIVGRGRRSPRRCGPS